MKVTTDRFAVQGEDFFLYSGEIHYFRIPRSEWSARLKALQKAGFNAVSTYIPWIWHEPEEGVFDFTGRSLPERDVFGFFDLARRLGLSVVARVGPVSNAELVHEGLPAWLMKKYPDVNFAWFPNGTLLSYLHPVFQEKVGLWYDRVLPGVAERQATRGGNILGVQLCNEVAMVHWLAKGANREPRTDRMFQGFLREKYGQIEALNRAHGASHPSFETLTQPSGQDVRAETLQSHVDWAEFYRRYYASYFKSLSQRARSHGIDVPLFCNIPQFYDYDIRGRGNWAPMTTSMFRDFPLLTPGLVFGGAYQMRHLDFENFHDVALTTEVTRLLSAVNVTEEPVAWDPAAETLPPLPAHETVTEGQSPIVCAELQTGIMRDRPRLYATQVNLNVKTSVGHGLAGLNAYMFAGGKNPKGLGAFGTYHDWQAAVGADGRPKGHLRPLAEFGRFLKWAGSLLAGTRKVTDSTLGLYFPYYSSEYWSGPWTQNLETQRMNLFYDGFARLAHLAGFNPNVTELRQTPSDVLAKFPSLWVFALESMDRETQEKLVRYVKEGGRLMVGPGLPTKDLLGNECRVLADGLGLEVLEEKDVNIIESGGEEHWVQGPVHVYGLKKGDQALLPVGAGAAVLRRPLGRGQAVVIGFGIPHTFDHFRDWVAAWAKSMDLEPAVSGDPWDVMATLRRAEDYGFLFVYNYHFDAREAVVSFPSLGGRGQARMPFRGRLSLPALDALILPVNVPLPGGGRLLGSTAEVRDLTSTARGLSMTVAQVPGKPVEIRLDLPRAAKKISVNGRTVRPVGSGTRPVLRFDAEQAETTIFIEGVSNTPHSKRGLSR
jgi:beta-galactosidase